MEAHETALIIEAVQAHIDSLEAALDADQVQPWERDDTAATVAELTEILRKLSQGTDHG
jgi:hypothetical protein